MLEFEVSAREGESSRTMYRVTGEISFSRVAYTYVPISCSMNTLDEEALVERLAPVIEERLRYKIV